MDPKGEGHMRLIATIAAAAAAFFAVSSAANAETISCPLSTATRTITNHLPPGWWTTPIQNTLTQTKIQNIGGKPALMCVYGPSGSIQRDAPTNQICSAQSGGFDCKPKFGLGAMKPIPGVLLASVHKSGPLVVPQTYLFDLDNGSVGGSAGADMWFEAKTATARFMTPRNSASIWVGNRSNRTKAQCAAGSGYTNNAVSMVLLPAGSYACVKTNEGRFAIFKVVNITGAAVKNLEIEFTTWN